MLQQKIDQLKKDVEAKNVDNAARYDLLFSIYQLIDSSTKVDFCF